MLLQETALFTVVSNGTLSMARTRIISLSISTNLDTYLRTKRTNYLKGNVKIKKKKGKF